LLGSRVTERLEGKGRGGTKNPLKKKGTTGHKLFKGPSFKAWARKRLGKQVKNKRNRYR